MFGSTSQEGVEGPGGGREGAGGGSGVFGWLLVGACATYDTLLMLRSYLPQATCNLLLMLRSLLSPASCNPLLMLVVFIHTRQYALDGAHLTFTRNFQAAPDATHLL
jgi:hypothetical protein